MERVEHVLHVFIGLSLAFVTRNGRAEELSELGEFRCSLSLTSYISAVAFPETISRGGLLVKLRPLYERIAHETIHNTRRKHVAVLADRLFYKQTSCFQPSWVNDIRSTARPIRPRPDLAYPRSGAFIRARTGTAGWLEEAWVRTISRRVVERGGSA